MKPEEIKVGIKYASKNKQTIRTVEGMRDTDYYGRTIVDYSEQNVRLKRDYSGGKMLLKSFAT